MVYLLNDVSTEGTVNRITVPGNGGGYQVIAGPVSIIEQQIKAGTAQANTTTETSLFTLASLNPNATGSPYIGVSALTIPAIPANMLVPGVGFTGKFIGTIANTGTPTLRTRVVLKNSAGTVVYTLADTTATAMTTVGTVDFEVNFDLMTSSIGTAGAIVGRVSHRYSTTQVNAVAASVAVDTTQGYFLDVLCTWGAASASNTLNVLMSTIRME